MNDIQRESALYIDGRWTPGGGRDREVENPATETITGLITEASPDDVEAAVAAARTAFPGWARTPVAARAAILRRVRDVIADRADLFADTVHREQGSPPRIARVLHVDTPLAVIDATLAALERFPFRTTIGNSIILRQPAGVVAAITPWNLPLHQVVVKVFPALAAGATVVLKPAELTPLSAFELARAFDAAGLPRGVFNLVPGSGRRVGYQLVTHPDVDQVSFTGSTQVGSSIAATAAHTLKRVTLELGGKSASVVTADVDDALLAKAVKMTVGNCYLNGGQTCTALSRLIVPENRVEQAETLAAEAAAKYIPGVRLGPLISAEHRKDVEWFLDPEGGGPDTITVVGGHDRIGNPEMPVRGHYVPPTVFSRVAPTSRLAREEIFGPVLTILSATSDDHAVTIANHSDYGLAGAVWSVNEDVALDIAGRLETGQVDINGGTFNPAAPFGGYKQSGLGREIGEYGIADVLEIKAIQW